MNGMMDPVPSSRIARKALRLKAASEPRSPTDSLVYSF
jgi:hypothetical protein